MKKLYLFLLIALITVVSFFAKVWHNQEDSQQKSFEQIRVCTEQQLDQEKHGLWQEISSVFGVDLEQFHKTRVTNWHAKPSKNHEIQNQPEKIVFEVAREFGYNTDDLIIELVDINVQAAAGIGEGKVLINTNVFATLPEHLERFIIAHELFHLINDDNGEKDALCNSQGDLSQFTPEQKDLFNKYQRFQEKRADLHAALHGPVWAELYVEYTQQGMKRCKIDKGITHPTFKERFDLAQNIVQQIKTLKA